jgi:MFS transporter, DHA2 family, multidrug resistance protein
MSDAVEEPSRRSGPLSAVPPPQSKPAPEPNRLAISACVILATLMQALDTTIANVALPYIQGSVSATQDQIAWVLTSYIVAAAIMTPPTSFLAARFGQKQLFLASVAGFTVASILCGVAQSLVQIVLFRVLQGVFGAALVPLSQAVLLATYPPHKHGSAMAMFGVAVMAGPVLGPVIGGWLTDSYSWRYVFYINVPIGLLAFAGMTIFLSDTPRNPGQKLDWFGFGTLSIAVGALQLALDRGQQLDWFGSGEIITEFIVTGVALYLFLVHMFTAKAPFVRPALFRDRNFDAGLLFIVIVGLTYYSSLALQPPFLQDLMGFPVVTAGLVMGPRGIGTMASMMLVGRLVGRVDTRILLGLGLGLTSWSFYAMTGWTPEVSQATIIEVGIVQGLGLGFLFVPLTVVTLSTLSAADRTEGAALYSLMRNIGSSVGISVVTALLTRNTQILHSEISLHVNAFNHALDQPGIAGFMNPASVAGRAALDGVVNRQAQIIAFVDDYWLLMLATLAVVPLLAVFRKKQADAAAKLAPEHAAVE